MIKSLNNSTVERVERPVTILQFGEGNFLRAFADWAIDIANERGVMNDGVVICKPRARSGGGRQVIDTLREQDNLYHVVLEGVEDMQPKREVRLVQCVMDCVEPHEQYAMYEQYITSEQLRVVISNTTEAGIRYVEGDDIAALPPKSYPAKMTALLYRRFKHFAGDTTKGLVIICCELIENNGSTLKEYVLRHARSNNLEQSFVDWVEQSCSFCDSLVDRIVSGFPHDTIDAVKQEIGYDDEAVVVGELYHLWVIGGEGYLKAKELLPLDEAGLDVVFVPAVNQFRDKKVRILNGSHTGMVALSLLMGCRTVAEAFATPDIERFVKKMVYEEVLPMIDGEREVLHRFADSILERFYNPYIKHQLKSIALNSLSKWQTRNYPTLIDNWQRLGVVANCECLSFAALLAYYAPQSGFEPDDDVEHIAFIRDNWDSTDIYATVSAIVQNEQIFSEDFSQVAGFIPKVVMYLNSILKEGMAATLKKFLG